MSYPQPLRSLVSAKPGVSAAPAPKSPNKLVYRLSKFDKALVFQILEQDDRFHAVDSSGPWLSYRTRNGFEVASSGRPSAGDCAVIHLAGSDRDQDRRLVTIPVPSNDRRDELYNQIQEALSDWATNAPQFAEPKRMAITRTLLNDGSYKLGNMLRYNLHFVGGALIFQILEQSPDIPSRRPFRASNGLLVDARAHPQIGLINGVKVICLQGAWPDQNLRIDITTKKHRHGITPEQVHEALLDWANNWNRPAPEAPQIPAQYFAMSDVFAI